MGSSSDISSRRVVLAAGVWMLVVVLGSWLVWTVISSAGQDFTSDRDTLPAGPGAVVAEPSTSSVPSAGATPGAGASPTSAGVTPTRSRTWTGSAGVVTARCAGARIELAGAAASADGYVVEVKDRGPDRVEVEFEGRGDETVPETRVRAQCVGGVPQFTDRVED